VLDVLSHLRAGVDVKSTSAVPWSRAAVAWQWSSPWTSCCCASCS